MTAIEEKGKEVQDSSVTKKLYYDLESVGGRMGVPTILDKTL
jgi:hypothetical protein